MATPSARGQRGITLIEIVLWCAIVAAAVVAVFVFGKKASVTAAVETEQRQVEDIVKTVDSIFATQPNFAALGTNGAVYLRERAARSGLKFQTNDAGDPILATGLGSGSLTLSSWDAVPPSGPAVPNSGYRLAYQGLASNECSKLVTATYPVAYQVGAGNDGLNDASATNLATRGQMTVSPAVIAESCAAGDGNATVFLYFYPARAIAGATTPTPPPAARCAPVHERQNVACPAGQTGTVTQERDGTCTGPGNTMVYTVWTTTNDTCQDPTVPPPTVTPPTSPDDCTVTTYTQVVACPLGQIGQIVQQRDHDTCAGTYTPWANTSFSCQPQPPTGTCSPSTEERIIACPAGQGGQIVQSRSSACPTPSSVPVWGVWSDVSNTCTSNCAAGAPDPFGNTCCTPIPEERSAPCPIGTYGPGGREIRFQGCVNATTQSATWSAWQPYRDLEPSAGCTSCPATTTETNTRWEPRTGTCPAGESGTISFEAEQVQTRDISYNCPAGTTALPAPTTTAWSGWTDTGATRNNVNTCAPSTCVGSDTENQWTPTAGPCPAGQTGTSTWEREQVRTRTCNAGTWTAWSGWGDTGVTRNRVDSCVAGASGYRWKPLMLGNGNFFYYGPGHPYTPAPAHPAVFHVPPAASFAAKISAAEAKPLSPWRNNPRYAPMRGLVIQYRTTSTSDAWPGPGGGQNVHNGNESCTSANVGEILMTQEAGSCKTNFMGGCIDDTFYVNQNYFECVYEAMPSPGTGWLYRDVAEFNEPSGPCPGFPGGTPYIHIVGPGYDQTFTGAAATTPLDPVTGMGMNDMDLHVMGMDGTAGPHPLDCTTARQGWEVTVEKRCMPSDIYQARNRTTTYVCNGTKAAGEKVFYMYSDNGFTSSAASCSGPTSYARVQITHPNGSVNSTSGPIMSNNAATYPAYAMFLYSGFWWDQPLPASAVGKVDGRVYFNQVDLVNPQLGCDASSVGATKVLTSCVDDQLAVSNLECRAIPYDVSVAESLGSGTYNNPQPGYSVN